MASGAKRVHGRFVAVAGVAIVLSVAHARADIDPNSGIDFVTIGAVGNAPWPGTNPATPGDRAVGRGTVNYEYRIGKFEVTTAQWVEFFNAAYDRPGAASNPLPHLAPPNTWGAISAAPVNGGTRRWTVPPGNEMRAVGNISWRMAAMYCNWLHNGKSTDRSAFLSGAYDVSTFGAFGNIFTDQFARSPGARYFIPSWDEWLKAAHYDPNKLNGDGTRGGWWLYSTTSDTAPVSNPPGSLVSGANGQVNAGSWQTIYNGVISPFAIPLGAYANVTSPWGLYDTAGATMEWTEEVLVIQGVRYRLTDGSWWVDGSVETDQAGIYAAGDFPNISTFDFGFRIASAIPGPQSGLLLVCAGACAALRRRRSCTHETSRCPCGRAGQLREQLSRPGGRGL